MDKLKELAEQIGQTRIVEHVSRNYGRYAVGALFVVAIVVGMYLGYNPQQVVEWLGQ